MASPTARRVLLLGVLFVAPALYLAWQALFDPRIEFLPPSPGSDWALHPEEGVLGLRSTPVSRELVFRRDFERTELPERALLRYRAFRAAVLELNGTPLQAPPPASWKRAVEVDLTPALRAGANTLTLRVHNPGAVPALLVTAPAALRTVAGWQVALATEPQETAPAATPRHDAPRSYVLFREQPSRLARAFGRPLLDALVVAWLALLVGVAGWAGWRRQRGAVPAPRRTGFTGSTLCAAVLVASLAFQLTNAFLYPAERSFVDSRDHAEYVEEVARSWRVPRADEGFQTYQPPAYYWAAAVLERLVGDDSVVRSSKAVQVLGALSGFALVLLSFSLARRLFEDGASRLVATGFAACLPMLNYTSPTVSNEMFAAAASAAGLVALVRCGREDAPVSVGGAVVAGVCCALALLSKYSGLFVAAAGALLLLAAGSNARDRRWRPLVAFLAVLLLLSGWLYLRNLLAFGDPFVGNWDSASGFHYEQEPGYRSVGFYAGFGRVFVEPMEHAPWLSFADGLYASCWAEIYRSFLNPNDDGPLKLWVGASLLLAAWPSLLILLGFGETLRRALRRPFADAELLLVAVPVWSLAALVSFTLEVPFYSTIKAFFLLSLVPVLAIWLARGRLLLAVLPRSVRGAGDALLAGQGLLFLVLYRYLPE